MKLDNKIIPILIAAIGIYAIFLFISDYNVISEKISNFKNEEKFPYLTKIYDSSEHGFDYHLKIFKIDYEKFESIEFN